MLLEAFRHALDQFPNKRGTVLEFGVASGLTFLQLAEIISRENLDINLVGFDSFRGLPEEAGGVWRPLWHMAGEHAFAQGHVIKRLAESGLDIDARFQLVEGFYDVSLKSIRALRIRDEIQQLIFVNIDVDLYVSTLQLLDYIKPKLIKGTVLYFDDWKDPRYDEVTEPWGEHRAWAEWSAANKKVKATTVKVGEANNRFMVITDV